MNKEFVPYEESLELKQLGFDEDCIAFYSAYPNENNQFLWSTLALIKNSCGPRTVTAPLYQQAFRWFREKHNLSGFALPFGEGLVEFRIYSTNQGEHCFGSSEYPSTEEAELECIKKLIEICKK